MYTIECRHLEFTTINCCTILNLFFISFINFQIKLLDDTYNLLNVVWFQSSFWKQSYFVFSYLYFKFSNCGSRLDFIIFVTDLNLFFLIIKNIKFKSKKLHIQLNFKIKMK